MHATLRRGVGWLGVWDVSNTDRTSDLGVRACGRYVIQVNVEDCALDGRYQWVQYKREEAEAA